MFFFIEHILKFAVTLFCYLMDLQRKRELSEYLSLGVIITGKPEMTCYMFRNLVVGIALLQNDISND